MRQKIFFYLCCVLLFLIFAFSVSIIGLNQNNWIVLAIPIANLVTLFLHKRLAYNIAAIQWIIIGLLLFFGFYALDGSAFCKNLSSWARVTVSSVGFFFCLYACSTLLKKP